MTEQEKRMHRCCFTGHRPEKLNVPEAEVKAGLKKEILQAVNDGMYVFITGMARGVDIWAAQIVLELREKNSEIKLMCAIPHPDFEKRWSADWQEQYNFILQNADHSVMVSKAYSRSCYQVRNEWMVNHSNRVIAVFNGEKSGTKNTVDYANKHGIEIKNIISIIK
ncbi:MAG: DUF1273 domain-containing protein [Firmicutes bacterium]|nr:DUF1273 domain-containing protein [Bacillota bacterium]